MRRSLQTAAVCALALSAWVLHVNAVGDDAQKPVKERHILDDRERTYLTFTPSGGDDKMPLLVLLHGSGRDAASILTPWLPLARKEHIVLVAPNSAEPPGWGLDTDGPSFIHDLVERIVAGGNIDPRRVYLFGHSAGGHHALDLALLESEYFAAVAVHAGVLTHAQAIMPHADRKIAVGMWNGTDDAVVPIDAARQSLQLLKAAGFPAALVEMNRHTHDYYGSAAKVNDEAWNMLKTERLPADPKFKLYRR